MFGANETWEHMPTGTFTWNIDDNKLHITKALIAGNGLLFSYVKLNGSLLNVKEIPSFKIKVSGLEGKSKLWYRYLKTEDAISETLVVLENGTHELPKSYTPSDSLRDGVWVGFTITPISEGVKEFDCNIIIEVIPYNENALYFDGVDDLGRVDGLPTLTDYTVVSTREWIRTTGYTDGAALFSKRNNLTTGGETGEFITESISNSDTIHSYSYGKETHISSYFNPNKSTIYQTKYSYNGSIDLKVGTQSPTDTLLLGERGPGFGFANIAIYNFLLYPYSLNSYLIDRQLKKLKLGSLNFNSVVWYPIVNSPILIDSIEYIHIKGNEITQIEQNKLYNYEDSTLKIIINTYDQFNISSVLVNGVECSSDVPGTYTIPFPTTSPQSISIITNNDSFVLDASNRWDSNGIWKSTGIFRY